MAAAAAANAGTSGALWLVLISTTARLRRRSANGSANAAGKERKDQFCAHADTFRLSAGRIARSLPPVISSAWYCRPPGTPVFAHSQTLAGLTPRRRATSACEPNSSMRSCSVIARILGLPKSKRNTFFARRLGKPKKVLALHLWKP